MFSRAKTGWFNNIQKSLSMVEQPLPTCNLVLVPIFEKLLAPFEKSTFNNIDQKHTKISALLNE